MEDISWARSATRHRISRERIRYVIEHGESVGRTPPRGDRDARLLFLGDDADGRALEVICVERNDGALLVIHAMPLRQKYREAYEEVKRWRR